MPLLGFKGEYLFEGYRLVSPFAVLVVRPADSLASCAFAEACTHLCAANRRELAIVLKAITK